MLDLRRTFALALSLTGLVACGGRADSDLVATYDGGTITRHEYESWLATQNATDSPAARRNQATALAVREFTAARAVADGLADEDGVRFALARLENRLLTTALRERSAAELKVSDAEVEAYLEAHDEERSWPAKIELSNILRRVPAGAAEGDRVEARTALAELRRRILAGEDFARLARSESDSETRYRGGRMGPVTLEQLAPEVRRAVKGLQPGDVTPVLEVEQGFTLLRCDGLRSARELSPDEARARVEGYFRRRAEKRAWDAKRKELLGVSAIQVDPQAVASGDDNAVVARFSDVALTRRELGHLLSELPSAPAVERASRQVLLGVIEGYAAELLLARRARELGLEREEDFQRRLRWRRLELLARVGMDREVDRRAEMPSEEAIEEAWKAHAESYRFPESFRVSVIRLDAGPDLEAQLTLARDLRSRIVADAVDFAAAARERSLDPSAGQGGAIDWATPRQLAWLGPVVLDRVRRLGVNEISEPLRQEDGLWLVRLEDRWPERAMSRDEALPTIRRQLVRDARRAAREALRGEILASLDLELR
jgi:parvulin-like peptidyl-prolyl isomerase